MSEAAKAVLKAASIAREEAYEFALRYVIEQRPETIARIKQLRETAELLEWAAEGRGGSVHDIDAIVGK